MSSLPMSRERGNVARRSAQLMAGRAALVLSLAASGGMLHSRVASAQESALMLGTDAPSAAVTTLDGQSANLSTFLAEKKPVVIEFWATWCPLCKELEPAMAEAKKKYDGRVVFVSVGVPQNQTPEKQRDYAKAHNLGGEFVFDRDGKAIAAYKANHTSYMVVVDAGGKVVYTGSGADQSIENAIAKAFPMHGM
jgi:cytochrome c biogenesis protein CcmG/thiol:disulfide interchange protein DsbE